MTRWLERHAITGQSGYSCSWIGTESGVLDEWGLRTYDVHVQWWALARKDDARLCRNCWWSKRWWLMLAADIVKPFWIVGVWRCDPYKPWWTGRLQWPDMWSRQHFWKSTQ